MKTNKKRSARPRRNRVKPSPDPHFECLRTMNALLGLAQDVEDACDNTVFVPDAHKLGRVKSLAQQIQKIARAYLPG